MKEPQVYSYSRFSRLSQRKGSSIERQRNYVNEIAKKYNLVVNQSLTMKDEGKSAFHATHKKSGAYGKFLEAVEMGEVAHGSILIIEGFDRLSREFAYKAQADIAKLIEKGITIMTASDNQIFNTKELNRDPNKLFLMTAVMIRAHEESLTKQKRSLLSDKSKVVKWLAGDKSVILNGSIPFWIKRTKSGLQLDETTAHYALKITAMYLDGKSMTNIIDYLNSAKIKTPERYGKRNKDKSWGLTTIANILSNEALYGRRNVKIAGSMDGEIPPYEVVLDDYFPALISKNDFDLIQQIKKSKGRGRAGYKFSLNNGEPLQSIYMLSGYGIENGAAKSVCSMCGGGMRTRKQHQFSRSGIYRKTELRLECTTSITKKTCPSKGIKVGSLEKSFLFAVANHIDFNLLNKNRDSRVSEVIESKLEELNDKIQRATDLIISHDDPVIRKSAEQQITVMTADKKAYEKDLAEGKEYAVDESAINEFKQTVARAFSDINDNDARAKVKNLLLQSISKMVLHTEAKTMEYYGYKNVLENILVRAVEVTFKSDKKLWVFHEVESDSLAFTKIENGTKSISDLDESELQFWNKVGDAKYSKHYNDACIEEIEKIERKDEWKDEYEQITDILTLSLLSCVN